MARSLEQHCSLIYGYLELGMLSKGQANSQPFDIAQVVLGCGSLHQC